MNTASKSSVTSATATTPSLSENGMMQITLKNVEGRRLQKVKTFTVQAETVLDSYTERVFNSRDNTEILAIWVNPVSGDMTVTFGYYYEIPKK